MPVFGDLSKKVQTRISQFRDNMGSFAFSCLYNRLFCIRYFNIHL